MASPDYEISVLHTMDIVVRLKARMVALGKTGIIEPTTAPAADGARIWSILGTPIMYSSPVTVIDGDAGRVVFWVIVDL
jgi:hypothetical protein